MKAKNREEQLLAAALPLAAQRGYMHVTRDAVADAAGVAPALVNVRFGTMAKFRRQLMRYAVRVENLIVVAQGLVANDSHARNAPRELQARALRNIAEPQ